MTIIVHLTQYVIFAKKNNLKIYKRVILAMFHVKHYQVSLSYFGSEQRFHVEHLIGRQAKKK
jgi:hypothetical protein